MTTDKMFATLLLFFPSKHNLVLLSTVVFFRLTLVPDFIYRCQLFIANMKVLLKSSKLHLSMPCMTVANGQTYV